MKKYVGIDPGLRNLGLAVTTDANEGDAARHYKVTNLGEIVERTRQFIDSWAPVELVGIEAYSFFGARKNYGPMCEAIGAIKAVLLEQNTPYIMLQPKQKEKAKLARPAGQEDHAYDARCIAWLTMKHAAAATALQSVGTARVGNRSRSIK